MKIVIHISELEAVQRTCAELELKCFVMEGHHEAIKNILITNQGREISPELAWSLALACNSTRRCIEHEKRRISEMELMPSLDITTIDVLP